MQTNDREVLFQKLGNSWYVFTETENDVVYSVLPEGMTPYTTKLELFEVIEDHLDRVAEHHNKNETAA